MQKEYSKIRLFTPDNQKEMQPCIIRDLKAYIADYADYKTQNPVQRQKYVQRDFSFLYLNLRATIRIFFQPALQLRSRPQSPKLYPGFRAGAAPSAGV